MKLVLGTILATPGALSALARTEEAASDYLDRHRQGDWGDLGDEDKAANDRAVEEGDRILSAYTLKDGTRVWIITEWSPSAVTTVLLPDEY